MLTLEKVTLSQSVRMAKSYSTVIWSYLGCFSFLQILTIVCSSSWISCSPNCNKIVSVTNCIYTGWVKKKSVISVVFFKTIFDKIITHGIFAIFCRNIVLFFFNTHIVSQKNPWTFFLLKIKIEAKKNVLMYNLYRIS